MLIPMLAAVVVLGLATLVLNIIILIRIRWPENLGDLSSLAGLEGIVRDEFRIGREESSGQARSLREEVTRTQTNANDLLVNTISRMGHDQKDLLSEVTKATRDSSEATRCDIDKLVQRVNETLGSIQSSTENKLEAVRRTTEDSLTAGAEAQRSAVGQWKASMTALTETTRTEMASQNERVQTKLAEIQRENEFRFDKVRDAVNEQLANMLSGCN